MSTFKSFLDNLETADEKTVSIITELERTVEIIDEVHNSFFAKYDISLSKFGALLTLYDCDNDGMILSNIGEQLLVSKANITGLIDRLEKQGFVERIRDNNDRRKISAALTDKGREFTEMMITKYKIAYKNILSTITEEEKNSLLDVLRNLQSKLLKI